MESIVVLGAGRVGSAIAADLQENGFRVTLADINAEQLKRIAGRFPDISTQITDVSNKKQLHSVVDHGDLVVNAVPGHLGFQTMSAVIEAGKDVVDISFFPEDALKLDKKAKKKDITVVVDCGVAPGLNNMLLGHQHRRLEISDFICMVGGLPQTRTWPFAYKAPFSPPDVIEEYMRPARMKELGEIIVKEPLSERELIDIEPVGTLEAFNTDGLRTLLYTFDDVPNMKEKTLRYPGHVEYIEVLKKSGFFDEEPLILGDGTKVSPREVTTRILNEEWMLGEQEEEMTIMRVEIKGKNDQGDTETVLYSLYDEYHPETGFSSMSRTTGYTATAVVNLLSEGLFSGKGVIPPEYIGRKEECFWFVVEYLADREVTFEKTII